MMESFRHLAVFFVVVFIFSCSQETEQAKDTTELAESVQLKEIAAPNAANMEESVAQVLTAEWTKLTTSLASENIDQTAQAKAYADYGLAAYGNGVLVAAEQAFENAVALAPEDARWLYFRTLMYAAAGELENAKTGFQRVLDMQPNNVPAKLRLANVLYELAEGESAEQLFSDILRDDPNSATALYGLGRIAASRDDHKSAVSYFEQALELQPYADRINYPLALSLRSLGNDERAKKLLAKRGTNEPHFADPLFDQIKQGQDRLAGLWTNMNAGSQAFVDGDYGIAVDEFTKATENHPKDPRSWQSLGMGLNKIGDAKGAIDAYQRALELEPENAVVNHTLAQLLIATGDTSSAEANLMKAIEVDPRMIEAHLSLADLYTKSGRGDMALDRYAIARDLDPQSSEIALGHATTLVTLGRFEEASKALEIAVNANPSEVDLRSTYAVVLAELGQIGAAEAQLKTGLEKAENDIDRGRVHYALGTLKLRESDGPGAIDEFGKALKLNPRHNAAGLELARTFLRMRDMEQALAAYEVHIGLWPDLDVSRIEAARVALMLGDGARAKQIMQSGLDTRAATPRLLGSLARLLVLTTDNDLRDPESALRHAKAAVSKSNHPTHLETLALVQSASGAFTDAVATQQRVLQAAQNSAASNVLERMRANLQRYQAKSLGRLPLDAI